MRSENGHPLTWDGPEMTALLAYMQWLSQGQPAGKAFPGRGLIHLPELTPNILHGERVYLEACSRCHGEQSAGGPSKAPPVRGPGAYNDGAGMNGVPNMAAFVTTTCRQTNLAV